MSKKKHSPGPVPPGNRPTAGPGFGPDVDDDAAQPDEGDASFQEQDPQRRLGNYGTAGEHPIQQPGRLNDGDTHRK